MSAEPFQLSSEPAPVKGQFFWDLVELLIGIRSPTVNGCSFAALNPAGSCCARPTAKRWHSGKVSSELCNESAEIDIRSTSAERQNTIRTRTTTRREQARQHAQEISDLANMIRNAVDAGIYHSAQEKLPLLGQAIAELSEVLNRLRLLEQRPPDYEHPEDLER